MKVAVIGSRSIGVADFKKYLPDETDEIISGGAKGVDQVAARYAEMENIKLTEIYPDYRRYGKGAPLKRNNEIIDRSDFVLAIWDGKSCGTRYVIEKCKKINKPVKVILFSEDEV